MVPGVNFGGVEVTDNFAFFLYLVIFQIFYIKKKKPDLTQKGIEPTSSQVS